MLQSQQKRQKFHQQIRQRQHSQIFRKIRKKAQERLLCQPNRQFQQVLDKLPHMYELSSSIQLIVDNQDTILEYIRQCRKFQDQVKIIQSSISQYKCNNNANHTINYYEHNNQTIYALIPLLQYLLYVVNLIHKHLMMDVQENQSSQQAYQSKQVPFAQMLVPINYMLINLLSLELPMCYIVIIGKFTKYRIFIDCFHNIFLTQNLPKQTKTGLLNQFMTHLQQNPTFFLTNCFIFIKILYYALQQLPKINLVQLNLQSRLLRQIQKIYSILTFNDKLQQCNKNEYKKYSCLILDKLCKKNMKMCWQIINLTSTINAVEAMLGQLKSLFNVKIKLTQDYVYDHLIQSLKFLATLAYYDQVASCLNQCYPKIWIHLLTILSRISIQYWRNNNQSNSKKLILPAIFQTLQFPTIVLKILKCTSNLICVPELCQNFIRHDFTGQEEQKNKQSIKLQWIRLLNQLYDGFYKYAQIRVECLCIFTNAFIIIDRSNLWFNKEDILFQNQCYLEQEEILSKRANTVTKIDILNSSTDMIMQVLKLSNSNRNIMICILQTLLSIIEKMGSNSRDCEFFADARLRNRITSIADADLLKGQNRGSDFYSQDVRLHAHHLMQALMINYE